jgi:RNA-directed DNA polymerase
LRAIARLTLREERPLSLQNRARPLKDRILLDNYYLPGDLERQINAFVEHYNHVRYHESIDNLTPADVYFGRAATILAERKRIKLATIANRRLQDRLQVA